MEDITTTTVTTLGTTVLIYRTNKEGNYQSFSSGETTIENIIDKIKNPSEKIREKVDEIRAESDKGKIKKLKSKLPAYIIQSVGDGKLRRDAHIKRFTGYAVLDFDGDVVRNYAEDLRDHLFHTYDCIVASFLSPTGAVKAILRIGIAQDSNEYRDYYRSIAKHFSQFAGFDAKAYMKTVQITYHTYDENILVRNDSDVGVWLEKEYAKKKPITAVIESVQGTTNDFNRVYGWIKAKLDACTDKDGNVNGHQTVIGSAKLLGGYCAYYGFDLTEAQSWIHTEIEGHWYLSKSIDSYKKTASFYIKEGAKEPIELQHDYEKIEY